MKPTISKIGRLPIKNTMIPDPAERRILMLSANCFLIFCQVFRFSLSIFGTGTSFSSNVIVTVDKADWFSRNFFLPAICSISSWTFARSDEIFSKSSVFCASFMNSRSLASTALFDFSLDSRSTYSSVTSWPLT